jgi:hypothetical protein
VIQVGDRWLNEREGTHYIVQRIVCKVHGSIPRCRACLEPDPIVPNQAIVTVLCPHCGTKV